MRITAAIENDSVVCGIGAYMHVYRERCDVCFAIYSIRCAAFGTYSYINMCATYVFPVGIIHIHFAQIYPTLRVHHPLPLDMQIVSNLDAPIIIRYIFK